VSTYGQTLDAQLEQLRGAGCTKIYREKVTGARADRRQLLDMLKRLAPGDTVIVTRIDRLARSTFDLFAIVKQIVDAKAQFRSLAEPWADTGTSTGRLMIAVLCGLADVERDLIRTRTAEGRSRAQKRGQQHMGRPPKLTEAQQDEARRRRAEGATLAELARSYGVGKSTISRLTICEASAGPKSSGSDTDKTARPVEYFEKGHASTEPLCLLSCVYLTARARISERTLPGFERSLPSPCSSWSRVRKMIFATDAPIMIYPCAPIGGGARLGESPSDGP
jgi:DNA invertase Pin-like site-specific DNA recombinase